MEKREKIENILSRTSAQIPEGLSEKIVLAINTQAKRSARIRAYVFTATSFVSAVLLYLTGKAAVSELYRSGTPQVFSLVFSDFQAVFSNLSSFVLTIAESLPVLSIVYVLSSVVALFVLSAFAINNIKKAESIKLNFYKHGYRHA
jgi:hypothetical protein